MPFREIADRSRPGPKQPVRTIPAAEAQTNYSSALKEKPPTAGTPAKSSPGLPTRFRKAIDANPLRKTQPT